MGVVQSQKMGNASKEVKLLGQAKNKKHLINRKTILTAYSISL